MDAGVFQTLNYGAKQAWAIGSGAIRGGAELKRLSDHRLGNEHGSSFRTSKNVPSLAKSNARHQYVRHVRQAGQPSTSQHTGLENAGSALEDVLRAVMNASPARSPGKPERLGLFLEEARRTRMPGQFLLV